MADDSDGTARVEQALLADGPEKEALEPAEAASADDEQISGGAGVDHCLEGRVGL